MPIGCPLDREAYVAERTETTTLDVVRVIRSLRRAALMILETTLGSGRDLLCTRRRHRLSHDVLSV